MSHLFKRTPCRCTLTQCQYSANSQTNGFIQFIFHLGTLFPKSIIRQFTSKDVLNISKSYNLIPQVLTALIFRDFKLDLVIFQILTDSSNCHCSTLSLLYEQCSKHCILNDLYKKYFLMKNLK